MTENSPATVDRENPWPGLASFTEDSRAFFFGREKETAELVRLIRRNTLTVLFGQSGLGKSSLLQAGAFPVLREADYLPLYLRLDHGNNVALGVAGLAEAGPSPSGSAFSPGSATPATPATRATTLADQVKAALVAAFQSVGADAPAPRADETLCEYFHRKDIDIWSAKNRLLTPVLAFDQFEEIFTLGRASEVQRERGRAFLTELADLVENRAPAALRARFDAGELDISRYNFDKPSCQVVLSLREDFLPDLEGLKHEMRSILHSRMRVKRLHGVQALEIVPKPAPHLIAEGVGEKIVEFVADFSERSVSDLPGDMRAFVEDHLLTKSGFRDKLALKTALEFPGVTRPLIDTLVNRRLLRVEDRLGVERVELTHDVLAEVIRGSRDTRQQRLAVEQARQQERITRRRMWLARTIAAGLLVGLTGVSWIAWRAIHAEREQTRLRADADTARTREAALRVKAEADELAARRVAYASDLNAVQNALASDNLGRARVLLNRHRPAPGQIDLRGWEWRYLWQFCRSDAQSVLKDDNESQIMSVAMAADARWAAVGHWSNGQLSVHNLQTGEKIRVPAGRSRVRVAFSPREPLLAIAIFEVISLTAQDTSSAAGNARSPSRVLLWDVNTRRVVRELNLAGLCNGLSFSEDGQTLVIGSTAFEAVTVWDVNNYEQLLTLAAPVAAISSVAFSPDGNLLAGQGFSGNVNKLHFWRAPSWEEIARAEAAEAAAAKSANP